MDAAEQARRLLVASLRAGGRIRSDAVARAFSEVPRQVFLPGRPVEAVYADEAVATKWEGTVAVSSASQPSMMAIMLEQLDVRPGHRVLEVGAGTGYNAALLAHLVGPAGSVTSIDIDEDIVAAAARQLGEAGFVDQVRLVCQDGALGYPAAAPYDRVVLTVGSWDIQPPWVQQLAPGGRLLLPLSVRGSQLSVAFDAVAGPPPYLRSASVRSCAFVRLRGAGARPEARPTIGRDIVVQTGEAIDVDADALASALRQPGADRRLSLSFAVTDLWDGLGLWLAVTGPAVCRLLVTDSDGGTPLTPILVPGRPAGATLAALGPESLAALVQVAADPQAADPGEVGVAVRPFGPDGERLADQLVDRIDQWLVAGRPTAADLRLRAYLGSVTPQPDDAAGICSIDKRHTRLLLDWPSIPLSTASTLQR